MADVSHELGALRFVVDSPLSSKVAMFNNQAQQHRQSQLLNPFSGPDGRSSPKPTFSKDEYGKPLAGSMTELRGQKANIHVLKEMVELCQIISSEGYEVKDEPTMRVIPFGELFNIYNYISDKVVGILLRARKHKLVEFEGEMLFQRRDDDVPIFLLKPIQEIRHDLESKIEDIKRASSPAPQATSILLDRSAHQKKLEEAGLSVPGSKRNSKSKSRSTSPAQQPLRAIASAPQFVITADAQDEAKISPVSNEESSQAMPTLNEVPPASDEVPKEAQNTEGNKNKDKDQQVETATTDGDKDDLPTIVVETSTIYMRETPSNESVDASPTAEKGEQQQQGESGAVTFY